MKTLVASLLLLATPALAEDSGVVLHRLLASPDANVSVAQLRQAGVDREGKALRLIALDRAEPRYVRARAASFLGGFEAAEPALRAFMSTPVDDREVQLQLVAAYAQVAGRRAEPVLVELYTRSRDGDVRVAAGLGLARSGSRAKLEVLLEGEKDPVVARTLRRFLSRR